MSGAQGGRHCVGPRAHAQPSWCESLLCCLLACLPATVLQEANTPWATQRTKRLRMDELLLEHLHAVSLQASAGRADVGPTVCPAPRVRRFLRVQTLDPGALHVRVQIPQSLGLA